MTINVVIKDRIRMPKGTIPLKDLKKRYIVTLYDESKCGTCSNRPDRAPDNDLCEECPAFQGVHRFYNSAELKEGVISLPQADEFAVKTYLRKSGIDHKWIDKRKVHPVRTKFKFVGSLYKAGDKDSDGNPRPDQEKAIREWMKKKVGKIQATARSGKTVLATYCYSELQVRTVIIANQKELLNQFYETATGVPAPRYLHGKMVPSDKKAGRTGMTNIPRRQEKTDRQIIFMPETFSQLERFIRDVEIPDVLLITYQSFTQDLARVARILNKYYSFAIIDEEHGVGADGYLRFAASLDMKYRLSLTATPDRKDGRSRLTNLVMGPVVTKTNTVTLKPVIEFYPVKAKPRNSHTTWIGAKRWQKMNKDRNIEIVRMAFDDLRAGHNVVIIPVEHKDHMDHLVKMINHQAKMNYEKRGEKWPTVLARGFHSKVPDRLEVLQWVDKVRPNGKGKVSKKLPTDSPKVLVAISGMIKQGVDMKRPSMLYSIFPISAKHIVGAPMFYQMSFRPCTPFSGKPQPVVRIFVDNIPMFSNCCSSLLFNEVYPNSTLRSQEPRYIMTKEHYKKSAELLKARSARKKTEKVVKWW